MWNSRRTRQSPCGWFFLNSRCWYQTPFLSSSFLKINLQCPSSTPENKTSEHSILRGHSFGKHWAGHHFYVCKAWMSHSDSTISWRQEELFHCSVQDVSECSHLRIRAGELGVQMFRMFVLNSHTTRFKLRDTEKDPSPCIVICVWFVTKSHHTLNLSNQKVMAHITGDPRGRALSQSSFWGTCTVPALPPRVTSIPCLTAVLALVQTTAFFCNMSSLTICLLSTTFFPAIHHH